MYLQPVMESSLHSVEKEVGFPLGQLRAFSGLAWEADGLTIRNADTANKKAVFIDYRCNLF